MQTIRKRKIESLLRETVSLMVLNGEIKDPRLNEMVTITDVDITADSRDAKIYVSVLSEAEVKDEIISTLNHAAGFIQKLLSKRVRLKNTPRLTFHRDDSLERGFKLNQMLKNFDSNKT
jgi:ribosome-binding factor A